MAAHTVGPWKWHGGNLVGGDYEKTKTYILDFGCGCCKCDDTSEADARLIESAPDLLEALKNLIICSERWEDTNTALVMEAARAAIAKATKLDIID